MKYIIMDLEMNPIHPQYKVQRQICRHEIIQIGAIALDESFQEVSSFLTYVKPELNDFILSKIENLTGISTAQVQDAPTFIPAIRMFFAWCQSLGETVQMIQWSSNDSSQLLKEIRLKEYSMSEAETAIMDSFYDFQPEFGKVIGLERLVSLDAAVSFAGNDFDGRQHDALNDARNTAYLFKIVRNPEEHSEALQKVADYLKPGKSTASLGELFDFGDLFPA